MTFRLETERLILEPVDVDDAPFFFDLMNSEGWLRFIGDRGIHSVEDARECLRSIFLASVRTHGFGYAVARRREDDRPVGICGFLLKTHLEHPDFGFALLPPFEGVGFAQEMSEVMMRHGLMRYGFEVVDAETSPDNHRSARLLMKLGFARVRAREREGSQGALDIYRLRVGEK